MNKKKLDEQFQEAFEKASNLKKPLPQDVMLRLYAYYKQATFGVAHYHQLDGFDLRDAFKINAWMQVSHLTPDEAKKMYIETLEEALN